MHVKEKPQTAQVALSGGRGEGAVPQLLLLLSLQGHLAPRHPQPSHSSQAGWWARDGAALLDVHDGTNFLQGGKAPPTVPGQVAQEGWRWPQGA